MTFMNCQKNNVFREIMNSSQVLALTASGWKGKYLHAVVCETDSIWLHQTLEPQKTRSCLSLIPLQIRVFKALLFYHAARHNAPTGIHHIRQTDLSKELNLATTFNCGAVTEMISYNSSEQADHFTSEHLCKIRAWTCFFPSSGLSFRRKTGFTCPSPLPMSADIKHMSPHFWRASHFFTSLLFAELTSTSSHLGKNFLGPLIWHNSTLQEWIMWISRGGTLLTDGNRPQSPYTLL